MINELNNTALIIKYKDGDRQAFDVLINNNMGLVKSTVKRFIGRGTDYEDLIQIGSIGLIKAVNAFNPDLGYEFSTYAFSMITGELRRHFRDDGIIKVSRSIKQYCAKMLKYKEEYILETGKEPSISYLAQKCGISDDEAILYIGALNPVQSTNSADENELTFEEKTGFDNIAEFIDKYALEQAVKELSKQEKLILYFRYNLSLTQNETAKRMGMNQVKISRTEKKIMEKLRLKLT